MQPLTLTIGDYVGIDKAKIIHFQGDFDGSAKETITDIEKLVSSCEPDSRLIFEFSGLNYLNSFAIGQLVAWHNTLNLKGGKIVIVGATKNVEDIFTVLGITRLFDIFAGQEEMKQALG